MLPAIFGLLGVIVGGAITAGVDYFLDERRASRDEAKERRKRLTDLKRAARLVDQDFNRALAGIEISLTTKQWWGPEHEPIRLQSWREYRSLFAAETDADTWSALKGAVGAMEFYQRASTIALAGNKSDLDNSDLGSLKASKEQIQKGRDALGPFRLLAID